MFLSEAQKNMYKKCIFLEEENETTSSSEEESNTDNIESINLPHAIAGKNVKTYSTKLYSEHKEKIDSFLLLANLELSKVYSSRNIKFHATSESVLKITDTHISVTVYGMCEKNGKSSEKTLSISAPLDNYRDVSVNRKNI